VPPCESFGEMADWYDRRRFDAMVVHHKSRGNISFGAQSLTVNNLLSSAVETWTQEISLSTGSASLGLLVAGLLYRTGNRYRLVQLNKVNILTSQRAQLYH
jgi:hypothetical protein